MKLFIPVILIFFIIGSIFYYIYFSCPVPLLLNKITFRPPNSSVELEVGLSSSKLIRLADVSPYLVLSVINLEDSSFFIHSGVDFLENLRALKESIIDGKRLRGASTISQQLVKNVFLHPARSPWRKIKEIIYALRLESIFTKDQILSMYLSIAPFSSTSYGVIEGSKEYFHKDAISLSPPEAIFLASVLPNPIEWRTQKAPYCIMPWFISHFSHGAAFITAEEAKLSEDFFSSAKSTYEDVFSDMNLFEFAFRERIDKLDRKLDSSIYFERQKLFERFPFDFFGLRACGTHNSATRVILYVRH